MKTRYNIKKDKEADKQGDHQSQVPDQDKTKQHKGSKETSRQKTPNTSRTN